MDLNKVLCELCKELLTGDIGSEKFNSLWIESGIPLKEDIFDVANQILSNAAKATPSQYLNSSLQ